MKFFIFEQEILHVYFSLSSTNHVASLACSLVLKDDKQGLWPLGPGGASGKEPACQFRRHRGVGLIPGLGSSLEEDMATHSSILARRMPWTEGPGRLYSPWDRKELDITETP